MLFQAKCAKTINVSILLLPAITIVPIQDRNSVLAMAGEPVDNTTAIPAWNGLEFLIVVQAPIVPMANV